MITLMNKTKTLYEATGHKDTAFWFKNGKAYEIDSSKHIRFILDNLALFNLTSEEVNRIYVKHHEKIGLEGKAREEIIMMVAKEGWIRVRHYITPQDYWTMQFDRYSTRKRDIKSAVYWLIKHGGMDYKDTLSLYGYDDNYTKNYTFQLGGVARFLHEKQKRRNRMILDKDTNVNGQIITKGTIIKVVEAVDPDMQKVIDVVTAHTGLFDMIKPLQAIFKSRNVKTSSRVLMVQTRKGLIGIASKANAEVSPGDTIIGKYIVGYM